MATTGWSSRTVTSLRGAWTKLDTIKAKSNRAFVATNVRFPPGRVTTRDGVANRLAVAAKTTSIYNWVTSGLNQVIRFEGTKVYSFNVLSPSSTELYTVASGRAAAVAEAATRAFIAVFNTSSLGETQARVVNGTLAGFPADKAFSGPMTVTTMTATDTVGTGTITAGQHYFAFIVQSRSGFTGKPSPVAAGTFAPVSLVAAGGKKVHLAVHADIPADAAFAYPIMTRVGNPNNWYFIPEGQGGDPNGLPGGTSGFDFSWDIDIADEDLAALATSADDNFDYAVQDGSGNGPMSPGFVKQYGQRMVYVADTDVWISNPDDHQALTTALHKRQMPGVRRVITALVIRGILYLFGPSWTYALSDRGGFPSTWGAPQVISGALGSISPLGVTDKTAGDYGWVANQTGLFLFRAVFDEKPITYLCAEWARINWAAGYAVQVVDDFVNQKVLVGAPLDSATEMTHIFVIDYSQGMTPYDVDISLDTFSASLFASGLFSSIGLVQETTNKQALWIGPAASGQIVSPEVGRRNDQTASSTTAIDSIYETGQVLNEGDSKQSSRVSRLQIGVKGAGVLTPTVYGPDRAKSTVAPTVTLSAAPDKDEEAQFDLSDVDNFSVRVRTNAVGAWFDLARIKPFWRGMWTNR